MGDPALRLPTFEELYAQIQRLPQGVTGEILTPGALRTMSRPGRRHRFAAKQVGEQVRDFDADRGGAGWWIEVEAEVRLGERLVVPDLAGWRVERVPALPEENPLTIVPDWCCEVLSRNTARDDRTVKLPLHAAQGVAWVWLVDPDLRALEVYETVAGRPTLWPIGVGVVAPPPFGTPLALDAWWLTDPAE
ncbi:MAG: Uma2 family endonuclease [Deltaproteobacteria bacterium]|nr:Uma2 family endonuclease [Myxococcales bacterium]MDP3214802.1 Uma2 family endonuclease [Deltaproteobacteria bacterium]